ncbi:MAG: efflux RND transporter periplasmic adaptor subunit [Parachlamydiales bacterium]|nr:efflux RND transporter periplasmic adaptor subunit [Parachlamydiales bacterium]
MRQIVSVLIPTLILCFTSCNKPVAQKIPPVPVTVVEIDPQTVPATFEYVGMVESSHIVQLRARVEGYLEKIAYVEGSQVQKGDLMFLIDPRPFEASLAEAKAMLEKQKALLWNAKQRVARYKPLYAMKAISQKDLDDAISQELASESEVDAAAANVETAELNLSFTEIRAPVTGMSNQAKFREGALISPGSNSLLTTLYVVDPIWVNFSISQGDLLKARNARNKGELEYPKEMDFNISVILADGTSYPAMGKVDFTDPSLQQSTGTMLVRAVVPNPDKLLHPGGFVRVKIEGSTRPNAIFVPKTSVQQGQNGMYVFVIDKDNVAHMRQVTVGTWYEKNWIITSGLEKGDIVAVTSVNRIHDGSIVNVTKTLSQTLETPPQTPTVAPPAIPSATQTKSN